MAKTITAIEVDEWKHIHCDNLAVGINSLLIKTDDGSALRISMNPNELGNSGYGEYDYSLDTTLLLNK